MTPNQIIYLVLIVSFALLSTRTNAAKNNFEPPAIPAQTISTPVSVPIDSKANAVLPGLKPASRHLHLHKIEELGKIHRFHRGRVRRVRKHEITFWFAIKIVIICCHLALLIHAFMHLSH